jgi:uncharacterized protein
MREHRVAVWRGIDAWRAEYADVWLHWDRLIARGAQLGVEPEPYRLQYALDTASGFATARLTVDASGAGWSRRLDLVRDDDGSWHVSADATGEAALPPPGGEPDAVAGAIDCDLAFSPLTNTMPILRERLLEGVGPVDLTMAWVSVPDLQVHRSEQRYEPIDERRVRFVGEDGTFAAELELDDNGLVVRYPELAEHV